MDNASAVEIPQVGIFQRHHFRFRPGTPRPGENESDDAGKSPLGEFFARVVHSYLLRWLSGLLVERRTSVSQIRGSIPGQVAAV